MLRQIDSRHMLTFSDSGPVLAGTGSTLHPLNSHTVSRIEHIWLQHAHPRLAFGCSMLNTCFGMLKTCFCMLKTCSTHASAYSKQRSPLGRLIRATRVAQVELIKCFHSWIADTRRFWLNAGRSWPRRAPPKLAYSTAF